MNISALSSWQCRVSVNELQFDQTFREHILYIAPVVDNYECACREAFQSRKLRERTYSQVLRGEVLREEVLRGEVLRGKVLRGK
jgi:hypothetical protein